MSDEKPVNRCECLGKTFTQLKALGSLEAAIEAGAGRECGGCLPYMKLMFASGETGFAVDDPRIERSNG